jgi:hypothetical protein
MAKRPPRVSPSDIDYQAFENIQVPKLSKNDIHSAVMYAASHCVNEESPADALKEILDCIGYEVLMESAV